jgi:hypothetical protein
MISIATFKNPKVSSVLQSRLALEGIESTLFDKVAFNSATQIAIPSVSVLINIKDEERAVEIMEEIGSKLID